jgi:uncharacterized protein (DUF427 family)
VTTLEQCAQHLPSMERPYKGDAAYFSIPVGGELSIDAVRSYETPNAAVAGIKDHLAFYPDRVDAIEIRS